MYKVRDDLALIQTVDFFTPIVDDPFLFGQIAAANALSDVYAMGGNPICAMNIACFPVKDMDILVLREIFRGGLEKLREAEVVLAGGHTVEDPELKYGLSVTGTVHPDRVLTNRGARPGDRLVLTKPLGTGIINTAIKGEAASPEAVEKIVAAMVTLNRQAAELIQAFEVHACTDVTGFGLLGHACEMIEDDPIGMVFDARAVPVFAEAVEYCGMGFLPGGLYRNRDFRAAMVEIDPSVPEFFSDLLFDPQTSGGLLIAVQDSAAAALVERMRAEGVRDAAVVGEVVASPAGRIVVR